MYFEGFYNTTLLAANQIKNDWSIMIVYVIPFLIAIYGSVVHDIFKVDGPSKKVLWIVLYIYLTLLIGLRHMVGGDTYTYYVFFDRIPTDDILGFNPDNDYQPFFLYSMFLAKIIYAKFVSYQLLHVFLINTALFWFVSKNSKYMFTVIFFCFLIFYINFTVEILRESLAIMVFMFNYKNLEQKKWIRYFIGVFIACMFHLSAAYLIILPFLQFLRFNYYYIALAIIATITLTQIQGFLTALEAIQKIQDKISFYAETTSSLNTTLLFLMAKFFIPVTFFFYAKKSLKQPIRYEALMCLLGLIGIGTSFNTLIFARLANYLLPFFCIALAEILIPFLRKKQFTVSKLAMYVMVFSSIVIMGYTSFFWPTGYYIKWVPYMSIFSPEGEADMLIYREE